MALKLEDKKAVVSEVAVVAQGASFAMALDYRGLTVAQINELRVKARKQGVYVRVVKNTLARLAVHDTEFACMQDSLVGSLMLLFSKGEPGDAARLVSDFVRNNEKCSVKLLALGGKLLDAKQLKAVAELPTREQAISMLMSVMQAPVSKLARTMAETYTQFVRVMSAVGDQKKANG